VNTVAVRMSIGAPLGQLEARGIDAVRQRLVQARGLLQESDWGPLDEPGPRTESSRERRFHVVRPVDDEWGRSESIDPDNVGDIADEGMGHRG
jgi:hypothetical protein